MKFAQLENNRVTSIIDGIEYKILPPNCVELSKLAIVKIDDIYEKGSFRASTQEDINRIFRPAFNKERSRLFTTTQWIRERHTDRLELGIDDKENWTAWLNYWQALRDMPAQLDFDARNPQFPVQPE